MKCKSMIAALLPCAFCAGALGLDWPCWRGPEQTGMTREKALVTSWSLEGENLAWKVPIGGRTTPVVFNGRLFGVGPVGEGEGRRERVFCLNADTGALLWEHEFNVFHTDIVENRVGWTSPVVDPRTGHVYVHATGGEFFAFDRNGRILWKRSLTEEFGRISGYGGRLHTPIILDDTVVISFSNSSWGTLAAPRHRYLSLEKATGRVLSWIGPGEFPADPTCYSTPITATIAGVRMMIIANGEGTVYGLKARTGEELWKFRLSKRGLNVTPVVDGKYVYVAHSEENWDTTEMGRVVCIDATQRGDITESGEVWRRDGCTVGYASPAVANGRLYVVDNAANLYCLDAKTGKQHWAFSLGRVGKGSPVVTADGVIYVTEQNGAFFILKDEGDKCILLDREEFTRTDNLIDEIFGSPVVADGRVFFMTRYNTYALGVKGKSPEVVAGAKPVEETPWDPSYGETFQLIPAEVALAPGESVTFTARQFSGDTVYVRKVKAPEWSLAGLAGEVSPQGTYTAPQANVFAAGEVVAKSGGAQAGARVRIVPRLPIEVDFEDMKLDSLPAGWIGAARKMKVAERDGSKVLHKLAENPSPPFMRVQPYITLPIEGGYVVEADMLGTPRGEMFKPDMGLVNSRYNLTLLGHDQALRVETWSPLPRLRKDVPFPWETEKWYRMKFEVRLDGDKGVIRGKVWPRGEAEPGAWTVEVEDAFPNREGSAGLYSYSPGTTAKSRGPEVFYDNIKVTKND